MAAWLFGCYAVGIVGYFVLGTWLGGGRTVGKVLLHLRLTDLRSGDRPRLWQCAVRYGVLYLVVMPTPAFLLLAITLGTEDGEIGVWLVLACIGLLMIYILFWLLLAVRYARKGFLAASVQLGGNVFSLVGARVFSGWAAAEVFQRFLAGSFRTQIAESISAGGVVDLTGIADKYAGFLPESFRASIVETCERSISAVLSDNAVVLADAIVQKVLAPLLTPVISVVLFFVAFALLRMLVSMLVTVLGLVNRLPVIGTVNRWLGWVTGCVASTMDIYLVLCVVWAVIVITGGNLTVLNDTVMSSSLYYKAFNLFNPFL